MPRDGSGNYFLPAGNPVQTGTVISSSVHNATLADIAAEISRSLAADGQKAPTANLPMGGMKHTNVGDATARNQYAAAGQVQDCTFLRVQNVAGSANAIIGSLSPAITSYAEGMIVVLKPLSNNTGAATLALNGLTARNIVKWDGDALAANDLVANVPALLVYDGTQFILMNPQSATLQNGVAMSDLARLSQHNTFNAAGAALSWPIMLASETPGLMFDETDAAANNRKWRFFVVGEQLKFDAIDDSDTSASAWLTVDRTGTTIDAIALTANAITLNGVDVTDYARRSQENNFQAAQNFNSGGATIRLKPGSADHVLMELYARSATPGVRTAWIGYGNVGFSDLQIVNEISGASLILATNNGAIALNGTTVFVNGNLVGQGGGAYLKSNFSSANVTISTSGPSGGSDGDIWLQVV